TNGYTTTRDLTHIFDDRFWSGFWGEHWLECKALFENHETLADSHVSRPIFFESEGDQGVDLWRNIWNDRDILIVAGKGSRFKNSSSTIRLCKVN
ncbi:GT-D fold domain-containing glycosyltransferase, partial [Corynebacterium sp. HMSC034E11]|uniref:GT-D fold domain-containing glycosyltransferase n=1 Tax=Corynebacterium sp. HMSC034E11 TaxID=1715169 RepID=UPI001AEFF984